MSIPRAALQLQSVVHDYTIVFLEEGCEQAATRGLRASATAVKRCMNLLPLSAATQLHNQHDCPVCVGTR